MALTEAQRVAPALPEWNFWRESVRATVLLGAREVRTVLRTPAYAYARSCDQQGTAPRASRVLSLENRGLEMRACGVQKQPLEIGFLLLKCTPISDLLFTGLAIYL